MSRSACCQWVVVRAAVDTDQSHLFLGKVDISGCCSRIIKRLANQIKKVGNGLQGIYLTELSQDFASVLRGLIGAEARPLIEGSVAVPAFENGKLATGDDLDVLFSLSRSLEEISWGRFFCTAYTQNLKSRGIDDHL